jgi:hypothetical protein
MSVSDESGSRRAEQTQKVQQLRDAAERADDPEERRRLQEEARRIEEQSQRRDDGRSQGMRTAQEQHPPES